jgi:hypothetical protein
VVIGTLTSWGEMRSVDNVLKLLLALFRLRRQLRPGAAQLRVVGYLGGRPSADISPAKVKELCATIDSSLPVVTADAKSIGNAKLSELHPSQCLILLDGETESLTPHFNTQLYHLDKSIRTGESSGSVHSSAGRCLFRSHSRFVRPCLSVSSTSGIPVILEMNGSEAIEGLSVIKVCDF